jgi:hypothetical protein
LNTAVRKTASNRATAGNGGQLLVAGQTWCRPQKRLLIDLTGAHCSQRCVDLGKFRTHHRPGTAEEVVRLAKLTDCRTVPLTE